MHIIHRAEIDRSVYDAYNKTSLSAEEAIDSAMAESTLREFDAKIRYIPIIMDETGRARYPARSRLERKKRIYNCCPQLPIEPFLTGTARERFEVYIGGLRECGPALAKLGASKEQVAEFDRILDEVLSSGAGT